jgi:hypothetical protein
MKKVNDTSKGIALFLVRKKIIGIFFVIIIVLLFPISKFIYDKFYNKLNASNEVVTHKLNSIESLTQGNIHTDIVKDSDLENENISTYTLEDGYSEVENYSQYNNGGGGSSSSYIDYSSLSGSNTTILEGSTFNPLKDLNLKATDKDGSNISNKIIVTENNVNIEKPGYYSVTASVKLSSGQTLQRVFSVNVKATDLELKVTSFEATEDKITKGENIIFDLNVKSSKKYVEVSAVNINGKEYTVYKGNANILSTLSNTKKYKIKVSTGDLLGVQDYKLSYIRMSDNTLINVDNIANIEILKSEPIIKDFKYETKAISKRIFMDFKLEDIDNSASNLRIEVYKDDELISTKNLDKKEVYEEQITTKTNGLYKLKILADINVHNVVNEENTILNKEIFAETINVTNVDETSLTGNDVEIMEGEDFSIDSLNIKATDVDGEDITDKVIIKYNNVNNDTAGVYSIIVNITNKNNKTIEKTFKITVVKIETNEEISNNIETNEEISNDDDFETGLADRFISSYRFFSSASFISSTSFISSNDTSESRASRTLTSGVISGNDTETLEAIVTVTGNITKADGTLANGKLQVEVPTQLSFTIDQNGNFKSGVFTIKNQSSTEISVSVGQFKETKVNSGITIRPVSEDLTNLDRSNIHLYLQGDTVVDLGEKISSDKELVVVPASDSKIVQLLGSAGKNDGIEVDANGASEEFDLVFKIKKKN